MGTRSKERSLGEGTGTSGLGLQVCARGLGSGCGSDGGRSLQAGVLGAWPWLHPRPAASGRGPGPLCFKEPPDAPNASRRLHTQMGHTDGQGPWGLLLLLNQRLNGIAWHVTQRVGISVSHLSGVASASAMRYVLLHSEENPKCQVVKHGRHFSVA